MTYSTDQRYHFQFQTLDLREKRGIGQGIWIPFARSSQFFIKAFQMMQFKIRIFKENGLRSIKNISILDQGSFIDNLCLIAIECILSTWVSQGIIFILLLKNRLYNPQTFFSLYWILLLQTAKKLMYFYY